MLENIDQWLELLAEIELETMPGDKHRILHLMANIAQARRAIERLITEALLP